MNTAYLFPGQGSQHVGMGRDLFDASPPARAVFDHADELLGFGLSDLCFNGPEAALVDTVNQQPAIFTASMATLRAAQADPEAYSDLVVRVAGYSDYFIDLGAELQNEIIAREAHQV